MQAPQTPLSAGIIETTSAPVDGRFLEQSYDQLNVAALEALDEATPKLSVRTNR